MELYLLDAGGAYLAQFVALLFLTACMILEAVTLILMKFNRAGKCFLDALLVNLASFGAGYLMLQFALDSPSIRRGENFLRDLGIMFAVTLVVEGLLLAVLNRSKTFKLLFKATLFMNLLSYGLLLIIYFK